MHVYMVTTKKNKVYSKFDFKHVQCSKKTVYSTTSVEHVN